MKYGYVALKFSLLLVFFVGCSAEPEIGSVEWCDKIKDKKASDLTIRENEFFNKCKAILVDDYLVGSWEGVEAIPENSGTYFLMDSLVKFDNDGGYEITYYFGEDSEMYESGLTHFKNLGKYKIIDDKHFIVSIDERIQYINGSPNEMRIVPHDLDRYIHELTNEKLTLLFEKDVTPSTDEVTRYVEYQRAKNQ